jgi:hypothetical protein
MTDNQGSTSENKILDSIKSGGTKMRPRWYFLVQGVLVVIACLFTLFLLIFAVSFIIFALQQNGGFLAAGFGLAGWAVFFHALPWSVLLLSLALVLILLLLLKRYSFIYHQPSLYLLLILVVIIALGSFFIEAINFHSRIENNDIPVVENVYQYETAPENYIYRGEIVALLQNGFILQNAIGETSTFLLPPGVTLNLSLFKVGEFVMIYGQPYATATIDIYGAQPTYSQ